MFETGVLSPAISVEIVTEKRVRFYDWHNTLLFNIPK